MMPAFNHPWDLTPKEAIQLQKELAQKVISCKPISKLRYIGGIDCAPSPDKSTYFAAAVIWDLKHRQLVEYHIAEAPLNFPYIPGLLSFREIPSIMEVIKKIQKVPDIMIVDGHGIAHPRHFGIACHLGVLLDCPTFGCGKSLLYGHYEEPGIERGSTSLLTMKDKILGTVLRTRNSVKPVIISIGHKVDLDTATKLTLECNNNFRLPEPTRLADKLVAQKQIKSIIMPNQGSLIF